MQGTSTPQHIAHVAQVLSALEPLRGALFFLACAERQVEFVHKYADIRSQPYAPLMRKALDEAWTDLRGRRSPEVSAAIRFAPNRQEFDDMVDSHADRFCILIDYAGQAARGVDCSDYLSFVFE